MTNSKTKKSTETIVSIVFKLLNEYNIAKKIMYPIDKAVSSFTYSKVIPLTNNRFISIISDFVSHVYEHGMPVRQILNDRQAGAQAIYLLERGYQNTYDKGYEAAYTDIMHSDLYDIDDLLSHLAEIIKSDTNTNYTNWVFNRHLHHVEWNIKCDIVEHLQKQWKDFLGENVIKLSLFEKASNLPNLFTLILESMGEIEKILHNE